jgi:hypothetical protein
MTDRNEKIATLWNDGMTSGQIAERLGLTRNAVMGRVNRMRRRGISLRTLDPEMLERIKEMQAEHRLENEKKKQFQKLFKIKKPRFINGVSDSVFVTPKPKYMIGVSILKLRFNSCRYIVSENTDENAVYCGNYAEKPPYCPDHAAMCYLPPKPRKTATWR